MKVKVSHSMKLLFGLQVTTRYWWVNELELNGKLDLAFDYLMYVCMFNLFNICLENQPVHWAKLCTMNHYYIVMQLYNLSYEIISNLDYSRSRHGHRCY